MRKTKWKRTGSRGFSLIELIIVIAIMAILVGIVGTQVAPYLNKAREAKDMQIINSYCTAALTAYASNAESFAAMERGMDFYAVFSGRVFEDSAVMNDSMPMYYWIKDIINLTGYSSAEDLQKAMSSVAGRTIEDIEVVIDFRGTITVQALDGDGSPILEKATAYIGVTPASEEDDDDD